MKNSVVQYLDIIEKKFPDKIAVETDSAKITFAEYKKAALSIATYILKKSDEFRKPITVYLPKNEFALATFMGILYSGNFYCPIPYGSPVDRANKICTVTASDFFITDHDHADILKSFSVPEENIYFIEDAIQESPDTQIISETLSHVIDTDPAYILFTSGSTGKPKGVMLRHRSVSNLYSQMKTLIVSGKDTVASTWDKRMSAADKALQKTVDAYKENE